MKIEFLESAEYAEFILKPETAEDFAQLARMSKNLLKEKPEIHLNFSDPNNTYCYLSMKKRKRSQQINTISNKD
jgi:hypothetical protein